MLKWKSGGSLDILDDAPRCQRFREKEITSTASIYAERRLNTEKLIMERVHKSQHERERGEINTPVKNTYKEVHPSFRDRSMPQSPHFSGTKGKQEINHKKGGIITKFKNIFKRSSSKGPGSKSAPNSPSTSNESFPRMERSLTSGNVLGERPPSTSGKERKSRLERLIDSRKGYRSHKDKSLEFTPVFSSHLPNATHSQKLRSKSCDRRESFRSSTSPLVTKDTPNEGRTNKRLNSQKPDLMSPQFCRRQSSLQEKNVSCGYNNGRKRPSTNNRTSGNSDISILKNRKGNLDGFEESAKLTTFTSGNRNEFVAAGIKAIPPSKNNVHLPLNAKLLGLSPRETVGPLYNWLNKMKEIDTEDLLKIKKSLRKVKVDNEQTEKFRSWDGIERIRECPESKIIWLQSKDGGLVSPKPSLKNSHLIYPRAKIMSSLDKPATKNNNNGHHTCQSYNIDDLDGGPRKRLSFSPVQNVIDRPSKRTSLPAIDFTFSPKGFPSHISDHHLINNDHSRVRRIVSSWEDKISTASNRPSPTLQENDFSKYLPCQSTDRRTLYNKLDFEKTLKESRENNMGDTCISEQSYCSDQGLILHSNGKNTSSEPLYSQGFIPTFSLSTDCVNTLSMARDSHHSGADSESVTYSKEQTISASASGLDFVPSENNSHCSISSMSPDELRVENSNKIFESNLQVVLTQPEQSRSKTEWSIDILSSYDDNSQCMETAKENTQSIVSESCKMGKDSESLGTSNSDPYCDTSEQESEPIQQSFITKGYKLLSKTGLDESQTATIPIPQVFGEMVEHNVDKTKENSFDNKSPSYILQREQETPQLSEQVCMNLSQESNLYEQLLSEKNEMDDLGERIDKKIQSSHKSGFKSDLSMKQDDGFTNNTYIEENCDLGPNSSVDVKDKVKELGVSDGRLSENQVKQAGIIATRGNLTIENNLCELKNECYDDDQRVLISQCSAPKGYEENGQHTPVEMSKSFETIQSLETSNSSADNAMIGLSYSSSDMTSYGQISGACNSTSASECFTASSFPAAEHSLEMRHSPAMHTLETLDKYEAKKDANNIDTSPLKQKLHPHVCPDELKLDLKNNAGSEIASDIKETINPRAEIDITPDQFIHENSITSENVTRKGDCSDNNFETGKNAVNAETTHYLSEKEGNFQTSLLLNGTSFEGENHRYPLTRNRVNLKQSNSEEKMEGKAEEYPAIQPLVDCLSGLNDVFQPKSECSSTNQWQDLENIEIPGENVSIRSSQHRLGSDDNLVLDKGHGRIISASTEGDTYRISPLRDERSRLEPNDMEDSDDERKQVSRDESVDSVCNRIASYYHQLQTDKLQFSIDRGTKQPKASRSDFSFSSSFVSEMSADGSGDHSGYCDDIKSLEFDKSLAPLPHYMDLETDSVLMDMSHVSHVDASNDAKLLTRRHRQNLTMMSKINKKLPRSRCRKMMTSNNARKVQKDEFKMSDFNHYEEGAFQLKSTGFTGRCQTDLDAADTSGNRQDYGQDNVTAVSNPMLPDKLSESSGICEPEQDQQTKQLPNRSIEYKPEQWLFFATMLFFQFIIHWLYAR